MTGMSHPIRCAQEVPIGGSRSRAFREGFLMPLVVSVLVEGATGELLSYIFWLERLIEHC